MVRPWGAHRIAEWRSDIDGLCLLEVDRAHSAVQGHVVPRKRAVLEVTAQGGAVHVAHTVSRDRVVEPSVPRGSGQVQVDLALADGGGPADHDRLGELVVDPVKADARVGVVDLAARVRDQPHGDLVVVVAVGDLRVEEDLAQLGRTGQGRGDQAEQEQGSEQTGDVLVHVLVLLRLGQVADVVVVAVHQAARIQCVVQIDVELGGHGTVGVNAVELLSADHQGSQQTTAGQVVTLRRESTHIEHRHLRVDPAAVVEEPVHEPDLVLHAALVGVLIDAQLHGHAAVQVRVRTQVPQIVRPGLTVAELITGHRVVDPTRVEPHRPEELVVGEIPSHECDPEHQITLRVRAAHTLGDVVITVGVVDHTQERAAELQHLRVRGRGRILDRVLPPAVAAEADAEDAHQNTEQQSSHLLVSLALRLDMYETIGKFRTSAHETRKV